MSSILARATLRRLSAARPLRCTRFSVANIDIPARHLAQESDSSDHEQSKPKPDWRKQQLETLEKRFTSAEDAVNKIQDEEDLQPMWKDMESRVKNRRSRTLEQNKGKIGRVNVRKTDEDIWLQEGLYDNDGEGEKK